MSKVSGPYCFNVMQAHGFGVAPVDTAKPWAAYRTCDGSCDGAAELGRCS
jgi:hypothetical protein